MLHTNTYYHIYNHANGADNLFVETKNYYFFLDKIKLYLEPIAEIFAWCLMPNHFHFLIKIKEEDKIELQFEESKKLIFNNLDENQKYTFLQQFISRQFAKLFSSYTQSFNKLYNRKGSLFIKNFKFKQVDSTAYYNTLIQYIHLNPIQHGFTSKIEEWEFTSYHSILSEKPTLLQRDEVLKWFGGKTEFTKFHLHNINNIELIEVEILKL